MDNFSDVGNAIKFSTENAEKIAYTDLYGWLVYDGKVWVHDEEAVLLMAQKFVRQKWEDAVDAVGETMKQAGDVESAKQVMKFWLGSQKGPRIKAMVELSKGWRKEPLDSFDAEPYDLNTPDGIVNLRTGELMPHDAGRRCTMITNFGPMRAGNADDEQGKELWLQHLDKAFSGDSKRADFYQLVKGMQVIGNIGYEGLWIENGSGNNGKSVTNKVILNVIGTYGGLIDSRVFTDDTQVNRDLQSARTVGKRMILATPELKPGKKLSTDALKKFCSRDMRDGRALYKDTIVFAPTASFVLHTNALPSVDEVDEGTWRRLPVIPFDAHFGPGDIVPDYDKILLETAGRAVMSWLIDGARRYIELMEVLKEQHLGFESVFPDAVNQASKEYKFRENWIASFLNDRCKRVVGKRVGARELYFYYRGWANKNGEQRIVSEREFAGVMISAGFHRTRLGSGWVYDDLVLA